MTERSHRPAAATGASGLSSALRLATRDPARVIRGFALYGLVVRAVGAGATLVAGLPWLSLAQILGAAIYGVVLLRARRVRTEAFLAVLGPEWVFWGFATSIVFGTRSFLYVHAITATAGILLLLHDLPVRRRLALFGLPLVLPIPLLLVLHGRTPLVELAPATEEALFLINQMGAIAFLVVVSGLAMLDHARAREFAEERAEDQTRLVEDLSHELRTPIATILTATQGARRIREGPGPDDDRLERIGDRLEWIEDSARASGQLVVRMLELAMLERGRREEPRTEALGAATRAVVDRLRPLAAESGIELRFRADADPGHSVDAASLEIVLRNLVVNALAHSPKSGTVEVRLIHSGGTVRVDVEDEGEGIAPEDIPHLFDRMWRADRARSRSEGRYGLGLSIAERHATLLGATIEVRSEVGRGSVFSLVFR